MSTQIRRFSLVLAVAALALLIRPGGADDTAATKKTPTVPEKPSPAERLTKRVNVEKFEGKFADAVKLLRDTYDLPLTVDPSVERGVMQADDGDNLVKLPKLTGVRTDTLLRLVCDQAHAVYLVYPDHFRLVNETYGLYESGVLKQPDLMSIQQEEPLLPVVEMQKARPLTHRALVTGVFKEKPLTEILDAITDSTGANVAFAPQAADKAKQVLTVRFANTPVDAAVRTLCEMTELGVIEDANVLLVTTRERAAARAKAEEEKRKARRAEVVVGNGGLTGLFGPAALTSAAAPAPTDVAGELAKLKEQNDQLRKQLDEVQKLLKK